MRRELFNQMWAALISSFPNDRVTPETQKVYFEMLKGVPDEAFESGVRKCLATCKFFPAIAELGEASLPAKTVLSERRVMTRNGLDRVPVTVTWQEQVAEIESQAALPAGISELARKLLQ